MVGVVMGDQSHSDVRELFAPDKHLLEQSIRRPLLEERGIRSRGSKQGIDKHRLPVRLHEKTFVGRGSNHQFAARSARNRTQKGQSGRRAQHAPIPLRSHSFIAGSAAVSRRHLCGAPSSRRPRAAAARSPPAPSPPSRGPTSTVSVAGGCSTRLSFRFRLSEGP